MNNEIEILKEIVNIAFNVDLLVKNRKRDVVDARRIFSKILRERNYGYEQIANALEKDHATVIHYMKNIDSILIYDKVLTEKYNFCRSEFLKYAGPKEITQRNRKANLIEIIEQLNLDLIAALIEKKQILSKFVDYIEKYESEIGYFPSIRVLRNDILPLFNE